MKHLTLRPAIICFSILCLTLSAVGCQGPVNPLPFTQWNASVSSLKDGAGAAADETLTGFRVREVQAVVNDPLKVESLMLQRPDNANTYRALPGGDGLTASANVERAVRSLNQMNAGLEKYAEALAQLAAGELIDTAALDDLARQINGHMQDAVRSAGRDPANAAAITGFFSAAARGAGEAYLLHQQRSALVKLLSEHQPSILAVSQLGQDMIALMHESVWQDYGPRSGAIARRIMEGGPVDAPLAPAAAEQRAKAVRELGTLNQELRARLRILEGLDNAYQRLPQAHQELHDSLTDDSYDLNDIRRLYDQGKRLYELYQELQEVEQPAP